MKIYFDTEFTGLHKNTTLISIGCISEDNKIFYAELTDYDKNQVDNWIYKNVISNLDNNPNKSFDPSNMQVKGDLNYVKNMFKTWLIQFGKEKIQFVSDVSHYDFVLLIDIFGTAFDLPNNINSSCHDINQDLAKIFNISEKKAFDLNREEIAGISEVKAKHNSLFDAKVIKTIVEKYKIDIR